MPCRLRPWCPDRRGGWCWDILPACHPPAGLQRPPICQGHSAGRMETLGNKVRSDPPPPPAGLVPDQPACWSAAPWAWSCEIALDGALGFGALSQPPGACPDFEEPRLTTLSGRRGAVWAAGVGGGEGWVLSKLSSWVPELRAGRAAGPPCPSLSTSLSTQIRAPPAVGKGNRRPSQAPPRNT